MDFSKLDADKAMAKEKHAAHHPNSFKEFDTLP
jgi:hypothetical protein